MESLEKIEYNGLTIVGLYLEKLEKLNDEERRVIIKTVDILNHPLFISGKVETPPPIKHINRI